MYDIVVIGAGVTGSASARALSRYNLKVLVLEKEEDVCSGTSKANSGIVHAGYDAVPGTLKAKLNMEGSRMMEQLSKDLDIPYRRNGSMVVCTDSARMDALKRLYDRGVENGVEGLKIISGDEARKMEKHLTKDAVAVLYAPTAAVVCPFELNIAMAENACENGVEFRFDTEVEKIEKTPSGFRIETKDGDSIDTAWVVNAAGVYADRFHNMVSAKKLHIVPRRGEYCLLDSECGGHVSHTIFPQPTEMGKGILVTRTVHGNLMLGPTADEIEDKEGTCTTAEGLDKVLQGAGKTVEDIPYRKIITSFAGLRAHEEGGDFVIGEARDVPGFIDVAGIESPGLTASPAIGEMVARIYGNRMHPEKKTQWKGTRKGIPRVREMDMEERNALVRQNPAYGRIVCRCEQVTEGEILDAVHRPIPARSLDGIKRRTRAGMGRCQSGFCSPMVMDLLNKEAGIPFEELTKSGKGAELVVGETKEERA